MSASPIQFDPDAMRRLLNPVMAAPSQPNLAIGTNSAPAAHQALAASAGMAGPTKPPMTEHFGPPGLQGAGGMAAPTLPAIKAPRGTPAGDQAEVSRLQDTGSGISQI